MFQLLSHRKRCCINVFQIFPWLITYREWTEGNFLNSVFCLLFSGVQGFSQKNRKSRSHCVAVRVTWAHCCFTVHIKKLYIQYVHSQQSSSPGEEHRGYGKQVWRLSFIRSVSFVSLFSSVGWARSQLCALTPPCHPGGRLTPTSQILGSVGRRGEAICSMVSCAQSMVSKVH